MQMKRIILAMALILIALLSSCGKAKIIEEDDDTEDENVETQNPYSLDDFNFTLIETRIKQSYGIKEIITQFAIPQDATNELISAHGGAYIEAICNADKDVTYVLLAYYENEALSKGYHEPLAYICCSGNKITKSFIQRNQDYRLTEKEIELYGKFQDAYKELTGDYARFETNDEEYLENFRKSQEYAPYEAVAEKLGVSVEEIINVNIKVTLYCLYIPDTLLRD